jgi:hypothetical protein
MGSDRSVFYQYKQIEARLHSILLIYLLLDYHLLYSAQEFTCIMPTILILKPMLVLRPQRELQNQHW